MRRMNQDTARAGGTRSLGLRVLTGCTLGALLLTGCGSGGTDPAATSGTGSTISFDADAAKQVGFQDPQELRKESNGITVTGARALSQRAVDLTVSTDAVSPEAPGGRNSLVVITPEGYDPAKTYPVVYMLPGSSSTDAPALQWYEGGQAEQLTAGMPVITVIMSGGKVGWYTDWAEQDTLEQNWKTFHLDQVVPWVDSHLATQKDRGHRAIMGNSMGGYGAVRYAEERPDLFGEAVSFSGLLDVSSPEAKQNFEQASNESTGEPDAIFGNGTTTTDAQWLANDPLTQSGDLEDVTVQLFAGSGNGQNGDIEPALRDSTASFASELGTKGVDYQYTEYGKEGTCDGGHTFECWKPAAVVALGRWADRLGLKRTTSAPAVDPAFEAVTSEGTS